MLDELRKWFLRRVLNVLLRYMLLQTLRRVTSVLLIFPILQMLLKKVWKIWIEILLIILIIWKWLTNRIYLRLFLGDSVLAVWGASVVIIDFSWKVRILVQNLFLQTWLRFLFILRGELLHILNYLLFVGVCNKFGNEFLRRSLQILL